MAKKIGAVNHKDEDELNVEPLAGLNDKESAEEIAQHFAAVSQEYLPLDTTALPAFLPAQPPPRIDELQVYLPYRLRKEFCPELAAPVADIFNSCL